MAIKTLRHITSLLVLLFLSGSLLSQKESAHVYGQLKDETTKKRLDNVQVTVFKDGTQHDNINTGTSGKYDITLPLGHTYDIRFSKDGYLQKIIRIDSRNIPEEERYGGFQFPMDGTLFPEREGFNTDLLKEPLALIKYDSQNDGLNYDDKYGSDKRQKIAAEHKRLDDLAGKYDEMKKQFDQLLLDGDKKMAESKYSDAMAKYQAALGIFPKDEVAKQKYNDAKARFDAENANKEFEAKYNQLMADAGKLFTDKRYEEAKKKYQEASGMKPNEKAPKEGIYECELALKDLEKRKEYDAILADADKKFGNKDYATSIEKYREASAILSNESYPKDQIIKAELALKAMLEDEAARLARRKDFDSKMQLAEQHAKEDNLEKAISVFKEASFILPEEKLPGQRISELEKILADRKKNADALAAKDNSEKERLEKEYNDLIKIADDFFLAEKLNESREKYVAALVIKPEANWPKSRIERIDLMLKNSGDSELARLRKKATEDSLNALKLASMDGITRRRMELDKIAQEQAEARRQILEDQQAAAYNRINNPREKTWNSQADEEAEDEVERYYRDAKDKEDAARNNEVRQRLIEHQSFHERKSSSQNELIAQREDEIKVQQQSIVDLSERGDILSKKNTIGIEQKKKDNEKTQNDAKQSADTRIGRTQKDIEAQHKNNENIAQNDRQRTVRIAENESLKNKTKKAQQETERQSEVLRKDSQNSIDKTKQEQKEMTYKGEDLRQERQTETSETIDRHKKTEADKSKAANERLKSNEMQINKQKENAQILTEKGANNTNAKANEIANQKEELELQKRERELKESQKHFEKRNELYDLKNRDAKEAEPTTESLAEGVTENSYKFGNKMITERKVTAGNKVDIYKKVVSKTAIYYFKNGNSISEGTWKKETLSNNP